MPARGARPLVRHLDRVVDLPEACGIDTDGEVAEGHILDAFDFGIECHNAWSAGTGREALRTQARTHAAGGLADDVGIAHVAEVELVHIVCAECPRVSD